MAINRGKKAEGRGQGLFRGKIFSASLPCQGTTNKPPFCTNYQGYRLGSGTKLVPGNWLQGTNTQTIRGGIRPSHVAVVAVVRGEKRQD